MQAWLLTWNPKNWEWQHLPKLIEETKRGKTVLETWSCMSKKVNIGDRVFLMKTGRKIN